MLYIDFLADLEYQSLSKDILDKEAEKIKQEPRLKPREEWNVWIKDAFKTWVAKDPWYWLNMVVESVWQLAGQLPFTICDVLYNLLSRFC